MTQAKAESGTVKKSQKKEESPLIFQKVANIMKSVEAITKDRQNVSQKYKFRGIDDVYNSLHDMLADEEVFTVPEVLEERHEERQAKSGSLLIYSIIKVQYRFMTVDASFIPVTVIGEGMDTGDKASNKAMAAAHKYALLQLFLIPTGEAKDSEEDSHDVKPKGNKEAPKGNQQQQSYPTQKFMRGQKVYDLTFYQALELFSKAKEGLGDKVYYTILGEFGFEKSNQVPFSTMPDVYAKMFQAYKNMMEDIKAKKAEEEEKKETKEEKDKETSKDEGDELDWGTVGVRGTGIKDPSDDGGYE